MESTLHKRGYYRHRLMVLLALAAVRAIRPFRSNQGRPVTGLIDRKVLTGGSSDENERAFDVVVRDRGVHSFTKEVTGRSV
jgi:hypothetical protein